MGSTRFKLSKPVIAAVEGAVVVGSLQHRRRFVVPLMNLGTIRLPRLIGRSCAMGMILTGRDASGEEPERIDPANRLTEPGHALAEAMRLALELARLPQAALRNDRLSAIEQWSLDREHETLNEFRLGPAAAAIGKTEAGARAFAAGVGSHGRALQLLAADREGCCTNATPWDD